MARPLHILLLSGLDEALSVERAALRQLGARVRGLRSGRAALNWLAEAGRPGAEAPPAGGFAMPDVLVCTEALSDMTARDFLRSFRLLAANPDTRADRAPWPPVLVVGGKQDAVLELGAAAVLPRPYTAQALAAALTAARSEPGRDFPAAAPEPAALAGEKTADMFFVRRQRAAVERPAPASGAGARPEAAPEPAAAGKDARINPLLYSRKGLGALRAGRLDEARELFAAALRADGLDLDACLGLAAVRLRRGDEPGERRWLNRAVLICLETGQKDRAAAIRQRLPRDQADNPYLTEARNLLLEKNYPEAVAIFLKLSLMKGQPPLPQLAARAAQLTEYPDETLRELCAAFAQNGQPGLAASLHRRLLADAGEPEGPEGAGFEPQSFWTRFPLLYEAAAVARFTLHAWRASGRTLTERFS